MSSRRFICFDEASVSITERRGRAGEGWRVSVSGLRGSAQPWLATRRRRCWAGPIPFSGGGPRTTPSESRGRRSGRCLWVKGTEVGRMPDWAAGWPASATAPRPRPDRQPILARHPPSLSSLASWPPHHPPPPLPRLRHVRRLHPASSPSPSRCGSIPRCLPTTKRRRRTTRASGSPRLSRWRRPRRRASTSIPNRDPSPLGHLLRPRRPRCLGDRSQRPWPRRRLRFHRWRLCSPHRGRRGRRGRRRATPSRRGTPGATHRPPRRSTSRDGARAEDRRHPVPRRGGPRQRPRCRPGMPTSLLLLPRRPPFLPVWLAWSR